MPYPDKINFNYSYTGFAQSLGNGSFPGSQIDADLAQVATDTNALNDFVRTIVRSDNKLQNGIVSADSLAADARAAFNKTWNPRGAWATATAYAVGDVVNINSNTQAYLCVVAHTSSGVFATDLAANRWSLWAAQGNTAAGTAITPAGNISSVDVQSAIYELDAEKQTLNANLTVLAGLAPAADRVPYFTASTPTAALATLTTFGRSLIDDADATAARTTLGLGSLATLSAVPDNSITFAKAAAGFDVQTVGNVVTAVATGTTLIPRDDTIPQITEGNEYLTQAITPLSATNILIIEAVLHLSHSVVSDVIAALFQDSGANALATASQYASTASGVQCVVLRHRMVAGTTSSTTFRVRAGGMTAGTTTFNGASGGRYYGGTYASSLIIREIKA